MVLLPHYFGARGYQSGRIYQIPLTINIYVLVNISIAGIIAKIPITHKKRWLFLIDIRHNIKEEVFPRIYIIAYPNWVTPYKMSMAYYGYNDKHIYTVIKRNKKHFKINNKGEYLAKPDFLINTIAALCELNKSEKETLKTLFDSDSFRTIM